MFELHNKLIDRLNIFLAAHPLDSMPTNMAVHVVCLYFRAKNSPKLESGGFFSDGNGPMPAVDLEFPGMLSL